MKRTWARAWRSLAGDAGGSEIAETAMILPLFFMVFMAIFWFGQAFRIYGTMAHATRAGAEAAVAPVCSTCSGGASATVNAQNAVQNALLAAHLSPNQLAPLNQWTPPALCACGSPSSACATPQPCDGGGLPINVCVQGSVQLSYPSDGGMGTCGISVSARYKNPYHFSIPGTGLDLGNMLLPGQAEMRGEAQ